MRALGVSERMRNCLSRDMPAAPGRFDEERLAEPFRKPLSSKRAKFSRARRYRRDPHRGASEACALAIATRRQMRQRQLRDGERGGRIDEEVAPPHHSRTRMFQLQRPILHGNLARGLCGCHIRDSPGKESVEGRRPRQARVTSNGLLHELQYALAIAVLQDIMNINALRLFLTSMQRGSLVAAATELNMSPSARKPSAHGLGA